MNINFSFDTLLRDIDTELTRAGEKVSEIQHYAECGNTDEQELEAESLEYHLKQAFISLCALVESIGLESLLNDLKHGFEKFNDKLYKTSVMPIIGELYSEPLGYLYLYHSTLSALFGSSMLTTTDESQRILFESILQNTAKIVYDRDKLPESEADVRKCVYDVLIHVFPDTVREIPICQETKTYKPDLGVKSIKAAAEYKYAVTEDEARKILGGFYEDMRGYSGSEDWKYFYAVVYMSKPFLTIQQIQSEFRSVKADSNWKPILVYGEGTRRDNIKKPLSRKIKNKDVKPT